MNPFKIHGTCWCAYVGVLVQVEVRDQPGRLGQWELVAQTAGPRDALGSVSLARTTLTRAVLIIACRRSNSRCGARARQSAVCEQLGAAGVNMCQALPIHCRFNVSIPQSGSSSQPATTHTKQVAGNLSYDFTQSIENSAGKPIGNSQ